ncbi:MAG: YqgE/AlgH family protein [Terrimonas sp.]|nr:YqgE/AlgH family protein [Terrimonas sp.]
MIEPAPGILLISDPFLQDPHFMRTVVLLCEHQAAGSLGFVINKKYDTTLDKLVPGIDGKTLPVYYGGPVQTDTIHFLHQYPDDIPGGFEVMKGVFWGGQFEKLIELLQANKLNDNKIRFFIGYSGWGERQLEEEMKEKSWMTVKATRKLLFHRNEKEIWKDALIHLGGDYSMLVNFPIDPQLN